MSKFGANLGHPYIKPERKLKVDPQEVLAVIGEEGIVVEEIVVEAVETVVEQVVEPASDVLFAIDEEVKEEKPQPKWKKKRHVGMLDEEAKLGEQSMPPIAEKHLQYRVGNTDRPLGEATEAPDDFIVYNTTNQTAYKSAGGVWISDTYDAEFIARWSSATEPNVDAVYTEGYKIGTVDPVIGEAAPGHPDGFVFVNPSTQTCFIVVSGLWADNTGGFDADQLVDWFNS